MIPAILRYQAAKGLRKWWLWIVITITVAVSIGLLYKRIVQRKAHVAKLQAQIAASEKTAAAARYALLHTYDRAKLDVLKEEARIYQSTVTSQHRELVKASSALADDLRAVEALKSWKELDTRNQLNR